MIDSKGPNQENFFQEDAQIPETVALQVDGLNLESYYRDGQGLV